VNNEVPKMHTYVEEWLQLGAQVIGGCCQIGTEEIMKIRSIVDKWNLTPK